MNFVINPEFWARWFGIVVINLALSGDNAVVIAMAVLTLPPRERMVGLIGGTAGAVVLRIALIGVVTQIFAIPYVQLLGGLVLIWIAVKLVRQDEEIAKESNQREVTSLWQAMGIIIIADLIMSLDNVMAVAAAAHGDLTLVLFGVGLSIPIVICGGSFLAQLMERFPWIVWLGGGILGWVAGELVISDAIVHDWIGSWKILLDWALPSLLAIALTILGWALALQASPEIAEEQQLAGNDQ